MEQFPQLNTINTTGAQNQLNSNIQDPPSFFTSKIIEFPLAIKCVLPADLCLSSCYLGAVNSMFTVGGFLGALSTIPIGDLLGRRRIIFIGSTLVIVGAALMASSYSLGQLIVARLIQGLGTGAITATVPVWQSELAGSAHRGAHVVAEGLFVAFGITASQWVDFAFSHLGASSISWRVPLVIQTPLSMMVMSTIFFMPESPRWLLRRNNVTEAEEIISLLRNADPRSEIVQREIVTIEASLEMLGAMTKWDLVKMGEKRNFHRLLLGICGQSFGQLCGIN
jgi:MFS family permease